MNLKHFKEKLMELPDANITDEMMGIITSVKVKRCSDIDKERKEEEDGPRRFCHVGHVKNTICRAKAFNDLPLKFQYGLMLHELGHLFTHLGDDKEADELIYDNLNIIIYYDDYMELEFISNEWMIFFE